ncbi:MAG: type II secretion system F family protein [Gammaproteobacteria bacterium]
MPVYHYRAVTSGNEITTGSREAASEAALAREIQAHGQILLEITDSPLRPPGRRRRALTIPEQALLTRSLATMLTAGMPLDRALATLIQLVTRPVQQHLVEDIRERVRGGSTLAEALEAQGGVFSGFYINMVRAGEAGGALETVLARLADHLDRSQALQSTLVSALIYPVILLTLSIASVMLLLLYVVPQFTELFESAGEALPWSTQLVIAAGSFLQDYWWALLLTLLAFLLGLQWMLDHPRQRRTLDLLALRLPRIRDLVQRVEVARFSRTLGTLVQNGVPLLEGLRITTSISSNQIMSEGLRQAADSLKSGGGLSGPLAETRLFPPLSLQLIRLGEETGDLQTMLHRVADIYDEEVRIAVQRLLAILEPVLIITLGILVAGIIISILVAILGIQGFAFT